MGRQKLGSYIGKFKYEIYLIIVSFFALVVHIHLASTLNLGNDEAHYYVWSLKPSLGYLDDAPLVGWVIYAFTWLLGKSQLSVRFGAVVFSFLDGFLVYYLSYILFRNKRAAFFSFLFFLSSVIFGMVLSVMILPDAPLLFFTLLFFIFFYKALTIDIEEKGTQERGQISNLSPFLKEAGEEKGTDIFYFEEINKSVPFSFLRGVGRRPTGRSSDGWFDYREPLLFSVCLSLPVLLFFLANGYSHRILVHWPDIGYLAAFPIMGYAADLLTRKLSYRILKYCVYFALFSGFFLSYILYNQIYYNYIPVGKIIRYIDREKRLKKGGAFSFIPHIPGKPSTADITNDLFGWRHSAKYIGIVYKGYKAVCSPLFILTHHYAIADELVYYGGYKPAVNIYNISGFLNQYDLWQNLDKINGENALFIMDNKYMLNPVKKYAPYFKSIKKIGRLDIYVKLRPVRTYYLYLMKDFNAKKAIKHLKVESRMY